MKSIVRKLRAALIAVTLCVALSAQELLNIPEVAPDKRVCFALYTVHNRILKLNAQLYPIYNSEDMRVSLEVMQEGRWQKIADADIIYPGYTAPFRVENWDHSQDVRYRVNHMDRAFFEGVIKKDPIAKKVITIAAFTGNSIYHTHGGDIARTDIVENLKKIAPDMLFFSGDQVYDHSRHLAYWLKFGEDFGEIIGSTPTVCIPDDHDVGQYNLWGAGGKKSISRAGDDGGYYMPAEYVKEVERAQTSHLPDPFDPTPIEQGIDVYYTALTVGGVSFAIIEDRKFKSGPKGLVPQIGPRPDHINDPTYDPSSIDLPQAQLLGDRQLYFLKQWGEDWFDCEMKAVLSQTIFCGGAHIHGSIGGRLLADLDSNGWPQSGRKHALDAMRKAFAVHIAGDQHLGTIFHHGIDDWDDANYSFCVPSIANLYLRWWAPETPGVSRLKSMPDYTGKFTDGFGNKITCWAAANPSPEPANGDKLTTRAAGFGIVRFDKSQRTITFECWPRHTDVTAPDARQYEGWPKTIRQEDNYGRQAVAYLPTIQVQGAVNPIVQVIDQESDEVVYTLRIAGNRWLPKVFKSGEYSLRVFDKNFEKRLENIRSIGKGSRKTLVVRVNEQ